QVNEWLKRERLQKFKLQPGPRINHGCASSVSVTSLSRGLRARCRVNVVGLYRDLAPVHLDRGEFYAQWLRFARIGTRRGDFSKYRCSSFQNNVSSDCHVLGEFRFKASTSYRLRANEAYCVDCQCCACRNRGRILRCNSEANAA